MNDQLSGELNVAETRWEPQSTSDLLREANNIHVRFVNSTVNSRSDVRHAPVQASSSNSHVYRSENHAKSLLSQLNQHRRDGKNCDLKLRFQSKEFTVHKTVLAATSNYFSEMVDEMTLNAPSSNVFIPNLDEGAAGRLLDYVYTGELCIKTDMVQDLLVAARILQLKEAETACWSFIEQRIDRNTCLSIFRLADLMGRSELTAACLRYVAKYFDSLEQNDDLLLLSENQFTQLVSAETLGTSEDNRLKAIIRWINYDCGSRQHLAHDLCLKVQVTRLSRGYLQQLSAATEPWLTTILARALVHHLPSPRESDYTDIIVVAGAGDTSTDIQCFDLQQQLWFTSATKQDAQSSPMIPALPRKRDGCAAVVVDDLLYILGGGENRKSVDIYDQQSQRWTAGPEMQTPRSHFGATVLERKVYAIGGWDYGTHHDSAEVLEPRAGGWRMIASMLYERSGLGVTAFRNRIYAVGGEEEEEWDPEDDKEYVEYVSSSFAESYNPETNEWTEIASMSTPRYGLGLCVLGNRIYAVGGRTNDDYTQRAEVYTPETDSWKPIARMKEERFFLGLVSHNGYLYAIGGDDEGSVERYDPVKNKWTLLPSRMRKAYGGAGVTLFRLKRSG